MPKNILLIEDAPQVAGILVSKMTREGHEVRWVRSGPEALAALEGKSFDLVLLSTYLEQDAWELLAKIRRRGKTPVVVLLENEEAGLTDKARQAGAIDVIVKPFKPTVVAKQVRRLLGLDPVSP